MTLAVADRIVAVSWSMARSSLVPFGYPRAFALATVHLEQVQDVVEVETAKQHFDHCRITHSTKNTVAPTQTAAQIPAENPSHIPIASHDGNADAMP